MVEGAPREEHQNGGQQQQPKPVYQILRLSLLHQLLTGRLAGRELGTRGWDQM